MLLSMILSFYS